MRRGVPAAVILSPAAAAAPALEGVEVVGVDHEVLHGPEEEGDLIISVKAGLGNLLKDDRQIVVVVQAVDEDGYEVFDVEPKGRFQAEETRALTDARWIRQRLHDSIVRRQVEE
jgi:hypothetical protein